VTPSCVAGVSPPAVVRGAQGAKPPALGAVRPECPARGFASCRSRDTATRAPALGGDVVAVTLTI